MKIERTKNASRNILFGGFLKVYQILAIFLMRTALIYFMGMQYLGLNSLFTSILQVLNLAELGVGSAMVYSMYKPIAESDRKTICALMHLYKKYYTIIGFVIAILGIILLPFIPNLIKMDTVPRGINVYVLYLLNLMSTVLSYWLFAYKNCLISAHQRTDIGSKIIIIVNTLQYVCQLAVLIIFKNYYYYVIVALGMQALTNLVTAVVVDKMYPQYKAKGKLEKSVVNQINGRVKDLFTAKIGAVVVNSVDTIVISAYLGLTVLAVYQNYYFILNAIIGFFYIIFSGITAGMGNSFVTESVDKNYDDLKVFSFIINWLICICCCCFIGLYQPFMLLWVGGEYVLPYNFVVLFCIYFYVYVLSLVWATAKDAAGMWHSDRFRPLIGAIANLVMNLVLVKIIGLYGVLLSTILSYILITMPWLIRNLSKELYKRSMLSYVLTVGKQVVVTGISCIISFFCCRLIKVDGIIGLIVYVIICFTIPNIIQYLIFYRIDEYNKAKKLVQNILKQRR